MNQLMMDIAISNTHWIRVNKGDASCRELADRHYSRQHIGASMFCRPGRNLVLRTALGDAAWVSWYGIRDDDYDAWECTIFRNESKYLSSELIRQAIDITYKTWGEPPKDGFITHIDSNKIQSRNPGYCFKLVGFKQIGKTKVNKLVILQYKKESVINE
jgi:hypothetical protein